MGEDHIYPEDETLTSLIEAQTKHFYLWEKRGRGWQVWNFPVEPEPPYEPFFHYLPPQKLIDDGRKATFFSSLIEKFSRKSPQINEGHSLYLPETYTELIPSVFTDNSDLKEINIFLSPDQKINIDNAEFFLLNLSYCSLPISFEIIGTRDSISIQLVCREPDLSQVMQQLKAYFPDATLNERSGSLKSLWDNKKETAIVDFGLSQEFIQPLRTFKNFDTDPLIGIVGALENLDEGEIGIFQILFQAVRHPWAESIIRSVTDWEGHSFFANSPETIHLAKEKAGRPLFGTVIRVIGQSSSSNRAWEIAKALGSGLSQLSNPQSNELIPLTNDDYDYFIHQEDVILRQTHRSGMIFNSEELVSLVHLPSISVKSKKLIREIKKTKHVPVIATGHSFIIGENIHQGKRTLVSLSHEERLKHMYIIGATGTGKSTFLLNQITQDIKNGSGLSVLDPHGDLIDRILGYVPEERFSDVVLFDPSDMDYPIGFNILSAHSEVEKNVLSSDLVATFRRLSTSWGDQMTSVLCNAVIAFLESKQGGTLLDLKRFLIEDEYRKSFLQTVKDHEVVYYWHKEFPLLKGNPQASILTRLDTFLRPKLIRYMVAQKEGLDFDNILNTKKIFLAKLAQGLIGEENAYLLGTLIVSKIHQVAMARQAKSISERENFYLYIDEFQNFITPSMASILSGARKYNLGLILAHQELKQLWNRDVEVANSVISNPGTRICFRLGDFDAKKLEEGFSTFKTEDLQNLGIGEAIARIERIDYDFNMKVLTPSEVSSEIANKKSERLIALTRKRYAIPKAEIEMELVEKRKWTPESVRPFLEIKELEEIKKEIRKGRSATVTKEEPKEEKKAKVVGLPFSEGKGGPEHKYLQSLIKKMAEEKGFRAIIEQPILDGSGSVDVGLEMDGKKIACEISLTSTDEQELKNVEKCFRAGYDTVILCSPEKKTLEKVRELVSQKLEGPDYEKVLFFQPEELYFYLEKEAASSFSKEERVKGFKVKVQYQPVKEGDKKTKREAVAQVILQALRRLRKEK